MALMAAACWVMVKMWGMKGDGDSNDDVIDMCRVEPMLTQSAIATLVDRLRHCRFRALRRAAPVNGRAFGLVSFLSH
jgi:hypothetical protein